jgi:hypothetical protein
MEWINKKVIIRKNEYFINIIRIIERTDINIYKKNNLKEKQMIVI